MHSRFICLLIPTLLEKYAAFASGAVYVPLDSNTVPVFYTACKPFYNPWTDGAEQWINPSGKYKVYPYYSSSSVDPSIKSKYWHYDANNKPTPW